MKMCDSGDRTFEGGSPAGSLETPLFSSALGRRWPGLRPHSVPHPPLSFPMWQLPSGLAAALPAASTGGVFDFHLLLLLRETVSCVWAVLIMRYLLLFPAHLAFAAAWVLVTDRLATAEIFTESRRRRGLRAPQAWEGARLPVWRAGLASRVSRPAGLLGGAGLLCSLLGSRAPGASCTPPGACRFLWLIWQRGLCRAPAVCSG